MNVQQNSTFIINNFQWIFRRVTSLEKHSLSFLFLVWEIKITEVICCSAFKDIFALNASSVLTMRVSCYRILSYNVNCYVENVSN